MTHRINKHKSTKGTQDNKLDGYHLSLILEDVTKCIKKSFDYSSNRTYVLQQVTQTKYNLQRRYTRMMIQSKDAILKEQQNRINNNLDKFYKITGKDRSIIPNNDQLLNLELNECTSSKLIESESSKQLEEPTSDPQNDSKIEVNNLDSWINDLIVSPDNIDNLVSTPEYVKTYSSYEQQISSPIVDIPETSTSQKEVKSLPIEIDQLIEDFINLPEDK